MKPFNIKEYNDNPSRKVVTRDGRPVRIIYTDVKGDYPVVGLILKNEYIEDVETFNKDGKYLERQTDERDLFFAPEKKLGWINVYKEGSKNTRSAIFDTKEEATRFASREDYVDTIRIEWEE